jgi:hypothetical protein
MSGRRVVAWLLLAGAFPASVQAQLGELHFGGVGSFAAGEAYQGGAGLTVSYAPGRLALMGMRWIYYAGSTERVTDSTGTYDVTTRAQVFGADLGLEFPLGGLEIVGGMTLGAVRFWQGTTPVSAPAAAPVSAIGTEFFVAPTLMVEVRAGPLTLIPQVAYYFAGSPDLRWPVGHNGLAFSLMLVIPIETDRIRY